MDSSQSAGEESIRFVRIRIKKFFSGASLTFYFYFAAIALTVSVFFFLSFVFFRSISRPKEEPTPAVSLDIRSFFLKGRYRAPDAENPSIIAQKHLELTRKKKFKSAYNFLSVSLKKKLSIQEFIQNYKDNGLLLTHVKAYEFPEYKIAGDRATVYGKIIYETGEASSVKTCLRFENGSWKISSLLIWIK